MKKLVDIRYKIPTPLSGFLCAVAVFSAAVIGHAGRTDIKENSPQHSCAIGHAIDGKCAGSFTAIWSEGSIANTWGPIEHNADRAVRNVMVTP